jgi:hypothetical protein
MLLESAPILDCQATRGLARIGASHRRVNGPPRDDGRAARLATSELVGQEGDILIGGGVGGGSGGTGQPVQVRRGGQR